MTEDKEKGLPAEMLAALESGAQDMRHNWMYSFMPVRDTYIYLVGYCKNCDHTVSAQVNTDVNGYGPQGKTTLTKANIPKWGCKPVEGL